MFICLRILIVFFVASLFGISCYADKININKYYVDCVKVSDNVYNCKLSNQAAKIKGYSCQGDSCLFFQTSRQYKSVLGKGGETYGYYNMPYALCSKSVCTIDKNNPKMAHCNCPVVNTKNEISSISIGAADRSKSLPVYDANGNMIRVISTYSLANVFNYKNLIKNSSQIVTLCKYIENHKWADCFGAPCTIDKNNTFRAVCSCPVQNTKLYLSNALGRCDAGSKIVVAADPEQFESKGIAILYKHFGKL